jgi:hypothetical protein
MNLTWKKFKITSSVKKRNKKKYIASQDPSYGTQCKQFKCKKIWSIINDPREYRRSIYPMAKHTYSPVELHWIQFDYMTSSSLIYDKRQQKWNITFICNVGHHNLVTLSYMKELTFVYQHRRHFDRIIFQSSSCFCIAFSIYDMHFLGKKFYIRQKVMLKEYCF